jgi:hypothetical protein
MRKRFSHIGNSSTGPPGNGADQRQVEVENTFRLEEASEAKVALKVA